LYLIKCKICGKHLRILRSDHFKSPSCQKVQHSLGLNIYSRLDYLKIFPNEILVSKELKNTYSKWQLGKTYKEKGYDEDTIERLKKIHSETCIRVRGGKTLEEMYGEKKALELKEKSSIFRKGKTYEEIFGEEKGKKYKEELSRARMGRVISEETKGKISKTQLGKHKCSLMSKEKLHEIRINNGMKGKVGWNKGDTKYTNSSVMKIAIATQARWDAMTPEEKYHKLSLMYKQPNKEEKYILGAIQKYGFRFCGNKAIHIGDHNPDFIHESLPIIIEYDGAGGHNPKLPWVPKNIRELDDERNRTYLEQGYKLIIITSSELDNLEEWVSEAISNKEKFIRGKMIYAN